MNVPDPNRRNEPRHSPRQFSKGRITVFFVVGGILLIVPLALIFAWTGPSCVSGTEFYCPSSMAYKEALSFFPFAMIAGGAMIAFTMKRAADIYLPISTDEEQEDLDGDTER